MILTDKVKIKISKKNIKHFENLGMNVNLKDEIIINPEQLNKGNYIKIKVKCDVCENEKELMFKKYLKNIKNGGFYACSSKCSQKKVKDTSLEKFGEEHYSKTKDYNDSVKQTSIEKYGCLHSSQNEQVKNKLKKTNLKKYNVDCVFKSDEIKNKIRNTNLEIYNVDNPSKNDIIKNKIINKLRRWNENKYMDIYKKYNIVSINYEKDELIFKCDNNKNHNFIIPSDLFQNRKLYNTILCTVCNPSNSSKSGLEQQLFEFISNVYNGIILRNKRIMGKQEIDIYLPDFKIGIEFNGLYWHNELNKSNDYHKIKSELSNKNNIKLIHIYEDDWLYKQEIIKSRILNIFGKNKKINGKKCIIKEIKNVDIIREFLVENHIKGYKGSLYNIGLYFDNDLISIMCFDKNNKLIRFCNKNFYDIENGYEELFNYFITKYNVNESYSYYDIGWNDDFLIKLGFKEYKKLNPTYYYIIDGIRKKGINMNSIDMIKNKNYKIYDSGGFMMKWQN